MKLLFTFLLLASLAHADSIKSVVALQQPEGQYPEFDNATNVLLGVGTPLLGPTILSRGTFGNTPAYLSFYSLLASGNGQADMTLTIGGITYTTGGFVSFSACTRDCGSMDSFVLPRGFYHPTPATLTVNFNGETKSYGFEFVEPVPEPGTLVLLATGLGLMALWSRRFTYAKQS